MPPHTERKITPYTPADEGSYIMKITLSNASDPDYNGTYYVKDSEDYDPTGPYYYLYEDPQCVSLKSNYYFALGRNTDFDLIHLYIIIGTSKYWISENYNSNGGITGDEETSINIVPNTYSCNGSDENCGTINVYVPKQVEIYGTGY